MLRLLVPSLPGSCRTFLIAAWNIPCGWNVGLTSAAKRLALMGVDLAILMETKITDDRCYPCFALWYKVLLSKATSHNQGGIALLRKVDHEGSKVKFVRIRTPNVLIFHLVTGNKPFYCTGICIPPPPLTQWGWETSKRHGKPALPGLSC